MFYDQWPSQKAIRYYWRKRIEMAEGSMENSGQEKDAGENLGNVTITRVGDVPFMSAPIGAGGSAGTFSGAEIRFTTGRSTKPRAQEKDTVLFDEVREAIETGLAVARNEALEEAVAACRKECAEWQDEDRVHALLCIAAIRALKT